MTDNYKRIIANEEKITQIRLQNEKDVAVSEDRMKVFYDTVKLVEQEIEKLGDLDIEVDIDKLANDMEFRASFLEDLEQQILNMQQEYLNMYNEFTAKASD